MGAEKLALPPSATLSGVPAELVGASLMAETDGVIVSTAGPSLLVTSDTLIEMPGV